MADHLAVLNMPTEALRRSHTVTSFEPFTLLSALAAVTSRIGLVATASTTFDEPYHVARRFASLDHLSNGRAGWNIVTTSNPDAARNFGREEQPDHAERYGRAREFYDVVTGLWDSFSDDAFIRDVDSGLFFDPDKMHVLDHKGPEFSVRGPLNIARPVQGWPVIVQAGASEPGRQLAAETAEVVLPQHPRLRQERPSIRTSRTGPSRRVVRATELSSCPALSFSWVTVWKRQRPNAPGSTALSIMTAQSPRFPLRSATMFRVSIPIAPCLIFPRPMPANPAAKGSSSLPEAKP